MEQRREPSSSDIKGSQYTWNNMQGFGIMLKKSRGLNLNQLRNLKQFWWMINLNLKECIYLLNWELAKKDLVKVGCRTLIGLDGCHLKGPYGGQLLIKCSWN